MDLAMIEPDRSFALKLFRKLKFVSKYNYKKFCDFLPANCGKILLLTTIIIIVMFCCFHRNGTMLPEPQQEHIAIVSDQSINREIVNDLPYARDEEDFLELIPRRYSDEDLFEWEPAVPVVGDPDEPGYMGRPFIVPVEKREEAKKLFETLRFNVVASDMIPLNRTYPDKRDQKCQSIAYPDKLPQTSVIIIFYNEAWSTLMRTLWSVCTKSPRALLKEIILVDDGSDREDLGHKLEEYIKQMPVPIKLIRSQERSGIVRARLLGTKYVSAPVMTFLDSHIECNEGWLEPLLSEVANDRTTVAIPVTDFVNYSTFSVDSSPSIYGTVSWNFYFVWTRVPKRVLQQTHDDPAAVLKTPAMVGGLFSIDKAYFFKLGSYDEKMEVWGGEEVEMSVRIWTCGGSIKMPLCSRVAHMARNGRFYANNHPGGVRKMRLDNTIRFVEVWADEYKIYFYGVNPDVSPLSTDISERQKLRKDLKCKSFRWYLRNIDPENVVLEERHHLGQVENVGVKGMCLQGEVFTLSLTPCRYTGGTQLFIYTKELKIQEKAFCVDVNLRNNDIISSSCHGGDNQKWIYNNQTLEFGSKARPSQCLTVSNFTRITLTPCDGSMNQKWILSKIPALKKYE